MEIRNKVYIVFLINVSNTCESWIMGIMETMDCSHPLAVLFIYDGIIVQKSPVPHKLGSDSKNEHEGKCQVN